MTPYERYLEKLQELKDEAEGIISGSAIDIQDLVYEALLNWMDTTLEYKNGQLVASPETIDLLNDFTNGFHRTITKLSTYKSTVSDFVKALPKMADEIKGFQKEVNGVDLKKAALPEVQKTVLNSIVDAFTDNGLNANIVQPLRDLLHQNISAGTRLQDARKALKDYVKGGDDRTGKVEKYLTNTAQQAVDGYTGSLNKRLMDTFGYDHMIVSGSIIATSAPQCRYAINKLNGIITREQYEKEIVPIAGENGLIAGTTFENLPLNKLHWGCRHEFTPVMLEDGDRIGTNEVYRDGTVVTE